jgi:hypothetical protein
MRRVGVASEHASEGAAREINGIKVRTDVMTQGLFDFRRLAYPMGRPEIARRCQSG